MVHAWCTLDAERAAIVTEYSKGGLTKSRGHWRAVIKYRDGEGEPWRQITKTLETPCSPKGNAGIKSAREELDAWRDGLIKEAKGRDAHPGGSAPVREYVASYIDMREKLGTIEASSIAHYRKDAKHIYKWIGDLPLLSLDVRRIDKWVSDMAENGTGASTIKKAVGLLSQACKYAVKVGDLPSNPCAGATRPTVRSKKPNPLDAASYEKLNAALATIGHTAISDAVRLLLLTGMRREEVCGLRWCDVDTDARTLTIRNAIGYDGGRAYTKRPKNDGSERVIPYGDAVAEVLKACEQRQGADCTGLRVPVGGALYVLGPATSQQQAETAYLLPDHLTKKFRRLAEQLDLKGTQGTRPVLHDLRHTFATHAIANGVDIETVSALLGHKNTSMTLDIYADALPDNKRAAMERMGALLSKSAEPGLVVEFPERKAVGDE